MTWGPGAYSLDAQAAFRTFYAIFLLAQLAITVPGIRRFFSTERYGGFVASTPLRDVLYSPAVVYVAVALWVAGALGLLFDRATLTSALVAFAACRYVLTDPRWASLSRGFGAVGHMTTWSSLVLVFLELSRFSDDAGGTIRAATLVVFRADLAMIMIVAGIYKLTAGYMANDGYQLALANPWWCFWSALYRRIPPRSVVFRFMNHSAYAVEILAGVAMLTPMRELGSALISLSFAYLATQLRLAFLPGMVVGSYFLFVPQGGVIDGLLHGVFHQSGPLAQHALGAFAANTVALALLAYLAIVILVRAGLCYNFYAKKRLPGVLQRANDALANIFVVTLWRVFTANVVNFFIDVRLLGRDDVERPYERVGLRSWRDGFRYAHAGEFVALCTTFTALKYFPDDFEMFRERLIRYAKTVRRADGERVSFVYVAVDAAGSGFEHLPLATFIADPERGTVVEVPMAPGRDVRSAVASSAITYGARPGSYAPS